MKLSKNKSTKLKRNVRWIHGFERNRDCHTCLNCGGSFERLYPAIDKPGFCLNCSNNKCRKCGIVLGLWNCMRPACNEYHGKRSNKDDTICLDCSHRNSKFGKIQRRKMFNKYRILFQEKNN